MSTESLLDNIMWYALSGPHLGFSAGTREGRRYAQGFSPIVGFPDPERPKLDVLVPFCAIGERFYCDRWTGAAPSGWQIDFEATMFKLVWDGTDPVRDEAEDALELGSQHAAQALALAELTNPGPFGLRTLELGDYFGYIEDGCLIAMAGERMQAGRFREISGVCTHPSVRGRGHAYRLMCKLLSRQLARGERPFLHVMRANVRARELYRRMGFREHSETVVRVVSRR